MAREIDDLCINTISIAQGSLPEKIKILADHGIPYVSIWYDDVKDKDIKSVKKLFEDSGVKPVSMSFLGPFNQSESKSEKMAREEDKRKIEVASELQIDTLTALTGSRNDLSEEESVPFLKRSLKSLSEICLEKEIRIAFEPIHYMYTDEWTYISTIEESLEIISDIKIENLGLMLDVYHVWMEPDVLSRIENAKGKIFGMQLSDWRPITRSKTDRGLPGDGCIPLQLLMQSAEKAGWKTWYDIEIFSDEYWAMNANEFVSKCIESYINL